MSLKVTHNGYEIEYDEGRDRWECPAINYDAPTLSGCKKLVDKYDLEERRIHKVPVLITGYYGERLEECFITSIERREEGVENTHVWVVKKKSGSREKKSLREVFPNTPETIRLFAERDKVAEQVRELNKKHTAMLEAIPRMTLQDIKELSEEIANGVNTNNGD